MEKSSLSETPPRGSETRLCPRHGEYASTQIYGAIWSKCHVCNLEAEEREAAVMKRAVDAREQKLMDMRFRRRGMVGRFRHATLDTFIAESEPQRKALEACKGLVNTPDLRQAGNLLLIGPPGTGKTHLANAMGTHVIRERKSWAAIHSAREIIRMLRATWDKNPLPHGDDEPQTETDLIHHLSTIELLCIDEVGLTFGTDSETIQLFDIIDGRYQRELPIVLCSNLALAELRQVLGERSFDRIREGARVVPCQWPSHRGRT